MNADFLSRVPSGQETVVCNDAVKAIFQGCLLYDSMTVECVSQSLRVVDITTHSGLSDYLSDIDSNISSVVQILSSGHMPTKIS